MDSVHFGESRGASYSQKNLSYEPRKINAGNTPRAARQLPIQTRTRYPSAAWSQASRLRRGRKAKHDVLIIS